MIPTRSSPFRLIPEKLELGPFTVSAVPISHSIPESGGLLIDCPAGRVIHTGDFKIDHNPIVGEPFDPELWAEDLQTRRQSPGL